MMEVQKQKEHSQQEIQRLLLETVPIKVNNVTDQDKKDDYESYFQSVANDSVKKDRLAQCLFKQKIKYEQERSHKLFNIQAIHSSLNSEIVTLEVFLGPFTFHLTLYNNIYKNYTHFLKGKASTFATIYECSTRQSQSIIKCTTFKAKDFLDTLVVVVKQYCFLKISAALGIGPQTTSLMGFDLIAYEDCIEFTMERCIPLPKVDEYTINILKQKLKKLHTLKIVHIDIKPENFCFSPQLNEPIFIDFGLTQVIPQNPGEATQTSFMGSLSYCCPEMTKLYYDSISGFIDLYYNDTVCMTRSFAEMLKEQTKNEQKINFLKIENQQMDSDSEDVIETFPSGANIGKILQSFTFLMIKNFIYSTRPIEQWYHQYEPLIMKNKDNLVKFVTSIPYTQYLQTLCLKLLSYNKFDRLISFDIIQSHKFNLCHIEQKDTVEQVIQQNDKEDEEQDAKILGPQLIIHRMKSLKNGMKIDSINLSKKELQFDLNKSIFLQSPAAKIEKQLYFRKFIEFSDLRGVYFSGKKDQQKIKIVNMMLEYLHAPNLKQKKLLDRLGFCWDHILNYFLTNSSQYYLEVIPPLVHNLVIVQFYPMQQLLQVMRRIGKLEMENYIRKSELIFMCAISIVWTQYRWITRYPDLQFKQKLAKVVIAELLQVKPYIPEQIHTILLYLFTSKNFSQYIPSFFVKLNQALRQTQGVFSHDVHLHMKLTAFRDIIKSNTGLGSVGRIQKIYYEHIGYENNLRVKYIFNYYNFQPIYFTQANINSYIWKNIQKKWKIFCQGTQLRYYYFYTPSKNIKQKEQFLRQLLQSINSSALFNSLNTIILIQKQLHYQFRNKKRKSQIVNIIRQRINFQYIMSIKYTSTGYSKDTDIFFYIFYQLVHIFYKMNYPFKQSDRLQQLKIISQYCVQISDDQKHQTNRLESLIFALKVKRLYEYAIKRYNSAIYIDFYILSEMMRAPLNMENSMIEHIQQIFLIMRYQHIQKPIQYYNFLYSVWTKMSNKLLYNHIQPTINFYEIFDQLLIRNKYFREFLNFNLQIIRALQDNFQVSYVNRYMNETYAYVSRHQTQCRLIITRLKAMSRRVIKECYRYNASCILVMLLQLDTNSDSASERLLRLVRDKIIFIKNSAKSLLQIILYRYLIYKNSFKNIVLPPDFKEKKSHYLLEKIKKHDDRKTAYMCRKIYKLRFINCTQVFPGTALIKNYKWSNKYHKKFKKLLRQVQKNLGGFPKKK